MRQIIMFVLVIMQNPMVMIKMIRRMIILAVRLRMVVMTMIFKTTDGLNGTRTDNNDTNQAHDDIPTITMRDAADLGLGATKFKMSVKNHAEW